MKSIEKIYQDVKLKERRQGEEKTRVIVFSIMTALIYTSLNSSQELSFLISPPILVSCLFEDSHSDSYEVVSQVGFDLHLPDDQ